MLILSFDSGHQEDDGGNPGLDTPIVHCGEVLSLYPDRTSQQEFYGTSEFVQAESYNPEAIPGNVKQAGFSPLLQSNP